MKGGGNRGRGCVRTLAELHVCDRLPFVHGHEPGMILATATQVDDELLLVLAEGCEHGFQACDREGCAREEIRGYYYLLLSRQRLRFP